MSISNSPLTCVGLLLVLGAADELLAEGERHVVPQLADDQPHLPRLEVEETRLVADLQTWVDYLSHLISEAPLS